MSTSPELAKEAQAAKKSFLRQWGALIACGIVAIGLILGYSSWTEYQANQPIVEEYDAYLRFLAQGSSKAREYRAVYSRSYRREAVTSSDFPGVCVAMTRLARTDGVDPYAFTGPMALDCRRMGPQ